VQVIAVPLHVSQVINLQATQHSEASATQAMTSKEECTAASLGRSGLLLQNAENQSTSSASKP
jgi:hypothetical protein